MPFDILPLLRAMQARQNHLQSGTQAHLAPAWSTYYENVLGTSMEVTLVAGNHSIARNAETALLQSIVHDVLGLSAWQAESEVSQWLRTQDEAVRLSPQLVEILQLFDHWHVATGGALNAAAETAARLWQLAATEHRLPSEDELAQAVISMKQQHWRIDTPQATATHLTDSPLALATFAKSYIAGRAADAALDAGASGVSMNIGGDVVVRGDLTQRVDIADPFAAAENVEPVDSVLLRDRTIATSGSYLRGFSPFNSAPRRPEFSHIFDPRTAQPTGHIVSSTVIARDAATTGALATAFSVLSPEESHELATKTGGVEYLLLTKNGERIASDGWSSYQAPVLRTSAYRSPATADAGWNQGFELDVDIELAQIGSFRVHRPYIAVWIEDENHAPIRTLALWFGKMRYLEELSSWYRAAQRVNGEQIIRTVSSPTRSPGKYTLKWDGKDDRGNFVKAGQYFVCVEAAREHGTHQIQRQEVDFNGKPQQLNMSGGTELGATTLDYHKR